MPMPKKYQLKDITDEQCRRAADLFHNEHNGKNTLHNLVEITGLPEKLCYAKLNAMCDGVKMECGIGPQGAWWVESSKAKFRKQRMENVT